jgi:hypothetical protein
MSGVAEVRVLMSVLMGGVSLIVKINVFMPKQIAGRPG